MAGGRELREGRHLGDTFISGVIGGRGSREGNQSVEGEKEGGDRSSTPAGGSQQVSFENGEAGRWLPAVPCAEMEQGAV